VLNEINIPLIELLFVGRKAYSGFYRTNSKILHVVLQNAKEETFKQKKDCSCAGIILHEFGHYVRYQKFKQPIHFSYFENVTDYDRTNPEERFAETFRYWLINPEGLKTDCPNRYAQISRLFKPVNLFQ
jgi:hypothetical protein